MNPQNIKILIGICLIVPVGVVLFPFIVLEQINSKDGKTPIADKWQKNIKDWFGE